MSSIPDWSAPDPLGGLGPVREVVAALARRGERIATAESLTAGLLAATIAGVPGASRVLRGGLIVYATDCKSMLAGVPRQVLEADGPVAESTALALARGAAQRCLAQWGVGLTGVAGPDPQDGHPVGTVFVAVVGPDGERADRLLLAGNRWEIRSATVHEALERVLVRLITLPD